MLIEPVLKNTFYAVKLSLINFIGLAFAFYCINARYFNYSSQVVANNWNRTILNLNSPTLSNAVYGQPIRLLIPAAAIDIPVNPGVFDATSGEWTLSGYIAQFATNTSPANNIEGNTFIYGHNNDFVFGSLRHNTPTAVTVAYVYTNNGHVFEYSFAGSYNEGPSNTSVFSYSGAPVLTVQTCTGALNEWRTMYQFNFVRVLS